MILVLKEPLLMKTKDDSPGLSGILSCLCFFHLDSYHGKH